ncbi:helix-turn-helix domain-containing protein [Streptomyces violaceorubidus]|uniref:helix-turn-helix domain-containing protein n=1 Tax=Streptomyces violaceorubidus TaxID=284042 RepID=UPI0004C1577F|nr:helix-turn-helix domain-containing protein [Streptomyces violaceorubidus]
MTAPHQPTNRSIGDVSEAIRWAETHIEQTFSIEDLAVRAHVSRSTFQRHFRKITGSAPLEWLTARRMDRAKHLLATTNLPIRAVARRSGFHDEPLFRYHWRRLVGGTPSGWRKKQSASRDAS